MARCKKALLLAAAEIKDISILTVSLHSNNLKRFILLLLDGTFLS